MVGLVLVVLVLLRGKRACGRDVNPQGHAITFVEGSYIITSSLDHRVNLLVQNYISKDLRVANNVALIWTLVHVANCAPDRLLPLFVQHLLHAFTFTFTITVSRLVMSPLARQHFSCAQSP